MTSPTTPLASMTGFARAEGHDDRTTWAVEARSVNGRSLDVRCRVPQGLEAVDAHARSEAARLFKRGNLSLTVTLTRVAGTGAQLRLNRDLLEQVLAIARELEGAGAAPPRLDALLAVRGIIDTADGEEEPAESRAARESAISATVTHALERLAQARNDEGVHLHSTLSTHVDRMEALAAEAGGLASLQPAAIRERLAEQVRLLLEAAPALPEERLVQEAALIAAKADVREELDRLAAHIAQARQLLAAGGATGRRLDFLCQEFNREANTLCSKSADVALTRLGLDLKVAIEQFREQVQNVE